MYRCTDCKRDFERPLTLGERHNLSSPPYENIVCCPYCLGERIVEWGNFYCHCCGRRVAPEQEYCSDDCRRLYERLTRLEKMRNRIIHNFELNKAVREVDEYNRLNKKRLSYGEYFYKKGMGML